jgi:hypothetical protein
MTRSHLLCGFAGLMLGFSIAIQANHRSNPQQPDSLTQEAIRFTN